jgi:hypothetical protein
VVEPTSIPDIITFTTSPEYLGLDISVPQKTLLKVSYGLELTEEEMVHFRQCTGRTIDPRTNFPNAVVVAGARAGKDSRLVGPVALYETEFGSHERSKGETGTIGLYAQGTTCGGRDVRVHQQVRDRVAEDQRAGPGRRPPQLDRAGHRHGALHHPDVPGDPHRQDTLVVSNITNSLLTWRSSGRRAREHLAGSLENRQRGSSRKKKAMALNPPFTMHSANTHGSFPGGCHNPERRRSVTSAFALSASGTAREFHAQDR